MHHPALLFPPKILIVPKSDHCLVLSVSQPVRHSLALLNFAQIVGFVKWISLKLLHGFVKIDTGISLTYCMDFSELIFGFLKVDIWISLSCYVDLSKLLGKVS